LVIAVTDDLVIDGDPLDRVQLVDVLPEDREPQGIIIDGGISGAGTGVIPIEVEGAGLRLEDLTIENAYGVGIRGIDADIGGARIAVQLVNGSPGIGFAIDMQGGSLQLLDSAIGYTAAPNDVIGIQVNDTAVSLEGSRIKFVNSESGFGILGSSPSVELIDSEIVSARGIRGAALQLTSPSVIVDGSTIEASGGSVTGGYAINVDGVLALINSTIVDSRTPQFPGVPIFGAAVNVGDGSSAVVLNSTISGSVNLYLGVDDGGTPGVGIRVAPGGAVAIANSIIDDTVEGTIASNGANTFRDPTVDGALPGDRLGVGAFELFRTTTNLGDTFERRGVLADNGGPTRTIALNSDPANPAIDAADPATAPAVDQRGFARDATPDIGAFEAGAEAPAPIGDAGLRVTTLADEVVVDGVVSLREAVLTANALPGSNTITFADDLRGGTITLTQGSLQITDDLVIDGDPADGGPGGITINGGRFGDALNEDGMPGFTPFTATDAALSLQDLAIRESTGIAVSGVDANLTLDRVLVDRVDGLLLAPATGVFVGGGTLALVDSTIKNVSAESASGISLSNGAEVSVINSSIVDNTGDFARGIGGIGTVAVVNSTISGNTSFYGGIGVGIVGNLSVENTTIADNGSTGISVEDGRLQVVNSTIAGHADNGIEVVSNEPATLAGVLADNGGPTQTVALLDDPANPALDAADAADAPAPTSAASCATRHPTSARSSWAPGHWRRHRRCRPWPRRCRSPTPTSWGCRAAC
jgi:CSLREA domain-containing protein